MPRVVQNSFTAGVLTSNVWARSDLQKYTSGCKRLKNCIVHVHGGVSNRPGTSFINEIPGEGRLIPFVYNVEQTYALVFTDYAMRIYSNGGAVAYPAGHASEGEPVVIVTPYAEDELSDMRFMQSADVIFITHPDHAPAKLIRTDHHEWSFEDLVFEPEILAPENLAAAKSGFSSTSTNLNYKVSSVSESGQESLPSNAVLVQINDTWPSGAKIKLTWAAAADATQYNIYKNTRGYYGWVGTVDGLEFTDDNIEPDEKDGPKEFRNPFEDSNNPRAVGIYQQRMTFGGSASGPQTIWTSQSGALNDFSVSHPLKDDDAITATIASGQVNEIRHFVPLKSLVVLTSGGEWVMRPGKNADALSPTSIQFEIQSYWGSSKVAPIVSGDSVLFVQNFSRRVRDLFYTVETDGFKGTDLSVLAEHLFDGRDIVDWSFQQDPYSTIWCVMSDGSMLSLTYMKEHEVWAWAEHETQGEYKSVCSLPGITRDDTYFITRRDVDGSSVFYVEYQMDRLPNGSTDVAESFIMDCGATYEGEATDTVSGLDHLEGMEVSVLADGSVIPNMQVSEGEIALPSEASKVHVGLAYESLMETLDPEINVQKGTTYGMSKMVREITLRVKNSRGFETGVSEDLLEEPELPLSDTYGAPQPLFSGECKADAHGEFKSEVGVVVRQTAPLPMTVLSIITEVDIGS